MALAVGVAAGWAGEAPAPTLKVGDPAPKLQVGKWVQGEPVAAFASGKAYIVEFWATWCGPCRVSIPHLNEIHNKYKDKGLIVIGQDCWEKDESLVEPFIQKMGDKMTYRVALDDKAGSEAGKMAETWMQAAGQNGIPSAFLVDTKGRIAWIGHPMALKESDLELVLAGKFDLEKAAADYQRQKQNEAEVGKLSQKLNEQFRAKEWDAADATLDKLQPLLPEEQKDALAWPRFMVLVGKKEIDAAAKLADKASQAQKPNPMFLNGMAWELATSDDIKGEPLNIAAKVAEKANSMTEGKEAAILDTLARINFLQGHKDKAVQLEEQAIGQAKGELKDALQKSLDSYKEGKLPDTH